MKYTSIDFATDLYSNVLISIFCSYNMYPIISIIVPINVIISKLPYIFVSIFLVFFLEKNIVINIIKNTMPDIEKYIPIFSPFTFTLILAQIIKIVHCNWTILLIF